MPEKKQHSPLTLWVQAAAIRIDALEQIVKKRLDVTDAELRDALREAALKHPLPDHPDSATALNAFLKSLIKP